MRLDIKQLKKMSVETKSGSVLGKVRSIMFETEGQLVAQYVVRLSFIGGVEYMINRDQVIKFEKDKIIVDDSVGLKRGIEERSKRPDSSPEPIAMRTEN